MHQEFDFYKPEEKIFGETIQPYKGNDESIPSKAVIFSGFPYDQGTRRNGGRIGGSVASSIFRKTLSQLQLYGSEKVSVYDSGDIETDLSLQQAHKLLLQKHTTILSRKQNLLFVSIGGSNDQSYPNVSALLQNFPKKVGVINIDSHFDVRPLKQGKAHSGSPFRLMLEDPRFLPNGGQFIEFANKGATCSASHCQYLKQKNCQIFWMEKVIRRHKIDEKSQWRTQGGQVFAKVMQKFQKECDNVFVSFDLDAINSMWMPGVSAPSVIGGLTSDEALEIITIAGQCPKVKMVDFSEFNPAVESILSGHLLSELFFTLCMNYAKRT